MPEFDDVVRERHRADRGDKGSGYRIFAQRDDTAEDQLEHAAGDEDRNGCRGPVEGDNHRRLRLKRNDERNASMAPTTTAAAPP